jgi:hypothetical protein
VVECYFSVWKWSFFFMYFVCPLFLFFFLFHVLQSGVSQALVVAMQRHIRFVRRVDLSRTLNQPNSSTVSSSTKGGGGRRKRTSSISSSSSRRGGGGRGWRRSGGSGFGGGGGGSAAGVGPWQYVMQLARVVVRHPFELLGGW